MNEQDVSDALKLLLVEESKKFFRLKEMYLTHFGKEFDEKAVEQELANRPH